MSTRLTSHLRRWKKWAECLNCLLTLCSLTVLQEKKNPKRAHTITSHWKQVSTKWVKLDSNTHHKSCDVEHLNTVQVTTSLLSETTQYIQLFLTRFCQNISSASAKVGSLFHSTSFVENRVSQPGSTIHNHAARPFDKYLVKLVMSGFLKHTRSVLNIGSL